MGIVPCPTECPAIVLNSSLARAFSTAHPKASEKVADEEIEDVKWMKHE
jgi:hypothetical protein